MPPGSDAGISCPKRRRLFSTRPNRGVVTSGRSDRAANWLGDGAGAADGNSEAERGAGTGHGGAARGRSRRRGGVAAGWGGIAGWQGVPAARAGCARAGQSGGRDGRHARHRARPAAHDRARRAGPFRIRAATRIEAPQARAHGHGARGGRPSCVRVPGYRHCAFTTRGRGGCSATARDVSGHARPFEPASGVA